MSIRHFFLWKKVTKATLEDGLSAEDFRLDSCAENTGSPLLASVCLGLCTFRSWVGAVP